MRKLKTGVSPANRLENPSSERARQYSGNHSGARLFVAHLNIKTRHARYPRIAEQKKQVIAEMTQVLARVLGKNPATTIVIIEEVETESWGIAGEPVSERRKRETLQMPETYTTSLIGLWLVLTTITLQAVIATGAHRRQSKMVPGIVDPALSHESFVFRSDRTFRNSLENIAPFFGLSVLAMLAGFSPDRLAIM